MYGTINAFEKKTAFKFHLMEFYLTLCSIIQPPPTYYDFSQILVSFLKESQFGVFELWDRSLDVDCPSSWCDRKG